MAEPLELRPPVTVHPTRQWPQWALALMGLLRSIVSTTSGHH